MEITEQTLYNLNFTLGQIKWETEHPDLSSLYKIKLHVESILEVLKHEAKTQEEERDKEVNTSIGRIGGNVA